MYRRRVENPNPSRNGVRSFFTNRKSVLQKKKKGLMGMHCIENFVKRIK